MSDLLWNNEEEIDTIEGADITLPSFIPSLTCNEVIAIVQGGCASGAYMPAVTYHEAIETMSEHGNDVLQFIEDSLGELPQPNSGESWSGMAVFYLSVAVELFASSVEQELTDALEELEEEETA